MLYAGHDVCTPSIVTLVECIATQVDVVQTSVEEDSGVLGQQVVYVSVYACLMALYYIAISGVKQIVVVVETVLRYGVVYKVVMYVQVYHQLRCECVVHQ